MKMEKDFFPVGREVAGIVLDGKCTGINTHIDFLKYEKLSNS
jgi:hypothetical protein